VFFVSENLKVLRYNIVGFKAVENLLQKAEGKIVLKRLYTKDRIEVYNGIYERTRKRNSDSGKRAGFDRRKSKGIFGGGKPHNGRGIRPAMRWLQ